MQMGLEVLLMAPLLLACVRLVHHNGEQHGGAKLLTHSSDAKEVKNRELGPIIFSKDIFKDLKTSQEVPPLRFHGLPRMP